MKHSSVVQLLGLASLIFTGCATSPAGKAVTGIVQCDLTAEGAVRNVKVVSISELQHREKAEAILRNRMARWKLKDAKPERMTMPFRFTDMGNTQEIAQRR